VGRRRKAPGTVAKSQMSPRESRTGDRRERFERNSCGEKECREPTASKDWRGGLVVGANGVNTSRKTVGCQPDCDVEGGGEEWRKAYSKEWSLETVLEGTVVGGR